MREEIGYGATSVVYEAEHRTLRHRVAIKVLRASSSMDHELRRRFDREMRLCAGLASMHIPHVYDVGELASGLPYIVMERLNGATLADWLAAHRKLAVPVAVEIATQLCSALAVMHDAGTIHRDIKPENIMLHRDRSDGFVIKLFDFGICKPVKDDGPALTARGTVVGTPEYMSPEQVGGQDLDERTDVYSTGVLLYELLAGRTPFDGSDLENLGHMILIGDPPRLRDLCPECPVALEIIVMRAMARSKKARYASMADLRRELERFVDVHGQPRHPRVWSLLPDKGPGRVIPLTKAKDQAVADENDDRPSNETIITAKLPMARGGIVTGAVLGLSVIAAAILSVGYYAFEPQLAEAIAEVRGFPIAPRNLERSRTPREEPALEAREPRRDVTPTEAAIPLPVPLTLPPALAPAPVSETPIVATPAIPEEPVAAPELAQEPVVEETPRERRRRIARERRAARLARARNARPRREDPVTTIAVGSTQTATSAPREHAPTVSSADLLAQVAPQHREPAEIPRTPYDETPANPF